MDKTYNYIKSHLQDLSIKAGRDKVRQIMRDNGLKYKVKRKAKYIKPIDLENAENMMFDLEIDRINQVWFSDITFLKTRKNGNIKLALVMDGYSRRILSYELSNDSSLAYKAYKKAMIWGTPEIHHSDRGFDYTNDFYRGCVKDNGSQLSYSRVGIPQDNGIMERTIGTLKNELGLKYTETKQLLKEKVEKVIRFYNDSRPHWSCNCKTPSQVYFNI